MSKMFQRLLTLPKEHSFFLFGARNTGKSTLLEHIFDPANCLWFDLLDTELERRFKRNPTELYNIVLASPENKTHVVLDEVQKIPELLDSVHRLMKDTNKNFIMTGSSARKLKKAGVNLLAGRAFVFHLHPLSYLEMGSTFNLDDALRFGTLPGLLENSTEESKILFLQAYAHTYLQEEIVKEQTVRNLDAFRHFLEVAAQSNGKIINAENIANDVGIDNKTVSSYFSILEDTLIGFHLNAYHTSFRKRLKTKPKFYFFDTGVTRSLSRLLTVPLNKQTYAYGDAFEHYIITECIKLARYFYPEYRFSYLSTKDDNEIDLIVERPGLPLLCIEIKSSTDVQRSDLSAFIRLSKDIPNSEAICLSQDKYAKAFDHIKVLPWKEAVKNLFTKTTE